MGIFVEKISKEDKVYLYRLEELGIVSVKRYGSLSTLFKPRWVLTDKGENMIEDDSELKRLWVANNFKAFLERIDRI